MNLAAFVGEHLPPRLGYEAVGIDPRAPPGGRAIGFLYVGETRRQVATG